MTGYQGKLLRGFEGDRQQAGGVQEFGTGVPGWQPTAFPPVAVFQRKSPPEGSETTDAANRIPSSTADPRTTGSRPCVDHREDERLPFVRRMDVMGIVEL